jgi:hypothetical protein
MQKITWTQAAVWRLRRHYLHERAPAGSLLVVASRLCGLHAQLISSAELSAWARIEDLDRQAVQRSLWEDRTLVKTWAMRGTLHLLPSSELPLWHAALATSRRFLKPAVWLKYFGITLDDLDQITEAIGVALEGRLLTREELARAVGSTNIAESSWGTLLRPAAFAGLLCFGPSLGQRVQFTRPDTWLATSRSPLGSPIDTPTATAEITRRFLAAYAPATPHDLARWFGGSGSITTARQWLAGLGDEVVPVDLEGRQAWMLTTDAGELPNLPKERSVRLLPGFDQYVVAASHHAAHLLPGDLRSRVYRPQGWISPVLLVNGRMDGVWRHEIKGSRIEVVIEPFLKTPAWVRRSAEREAERLASFLGGTISITWKS